MSVLIHIDDVDDRRLDDYRGLRDPARRSRVEAEEGFFVAEGIKVVERLLESAIRLRSLLLTEANARRLEPGLVGIDAPVYVVDRRQMEAIVGFDLHRGALAAADRPRPVSLHEAIVGRRLVCALEGINDHENLGAIIRSAVAFGVEAMVLDPTCADPWYRRSVRVSMGTVFDVRIARTEQWPESIGTARTLGFQVVALTLGADAVPIGSFDLHGPTMVMLGAEGPGLSPAAIEASDVQVTIPIDPGVDSLNVGHAAAIAFHRLAGVTGRSRR